MLDNLRESAASSPFLEDEEELPDFLGEAPPPQKPRKPRKPLLGMTPPQRFALSMMMFITVCLLGVMAMFILGRFMVPTF
ncbi:MAG: hypothetical protein AB1846_07350 [Chloroflexota bacterium]